MGDLARGVSETLPFIAFVPAEVVQVVEFIGTRRERPEARWQSHPGRLHGSNIDNVQVRKQSNVVRALQQSTPEQRADESDHRISVVFFDASEWTKQAFDRPEITEHLHLRFFKEPLSLAATPLASGHRVVSCFVNCDLGAPVMRALSEFGVRMIAMRCAGFDRVCIDSARAFGLTVARVPAYSPYAVAEFALSLLMTLNRRVHTTCQRVRNGNFSLQGLVGFDVHGKTVGIIGTGA